MNLAQRIVKAGVLEPEQLAPALFRQKKSRGYLAQHLLDLNLVEPEVLAQFVHAYPPVPETFEDLGVPKGVLIQLLLKQCLFRDSISSQEMAHDLKISRRMVDELFAYLKGQGYVQVKARDALSQTSQMALDLRYSLTDSGKIYAEQCLESNRYVGPVPVPLEDYWDWVEAQSINQVKVEKDHLREVFDDYVVPDHLLTKLGPAINSGRSIFLFGPSGNGKTVIANCHRPCLSGCGLCPVCPVCLRPDYPPVRRTQPPARPPNPGNPGSRQTLGVMPAAHRHRRGRDDRRCPGTEV